MGNRGGPIADDPQRRQWARRAWIYCHLEFNGRERVFRDPGRRYTELFFFDEAHALAAGHRPCGECQHRRLQEFKAAAGFTAETRVATIDIELHSQRIGNDGRYASIGSLPDGAFVVLDDQPTLVWGEHIFGWHPERGYARVPAPPAGTRVAVVTPAIILTALASGFRVQPDLPH